MSLDKYKKKRNLEKSGEPKSKIKSSGKNIFVVQEHDASHLHWDFRLEYKGVLKSWAVPKEPPKDTKTKRLAIQVEDHPLDYADFEGEILEGYGKGTVKIWDKGEYELKNFDDKKIEFKLNGEKLKGNYVLIKTKYNSSKNKKNKNWLFFKLR